MYKIKYIFSFAILLLMIFLKTDLKAQDNTLNGVSPSGDNSKILSYDIPEEMKPGEEFVVTINMLNTGNNKWTKSENYKLSLFDQADNMFQADVWGVKEVSVPFDVNPDEKVMFLFKITAPDETGTYNCRWVMTKNDQFFGEYTAKMVTVKNETGTFSSDDEGNNSRFISIDIPEFMNSGEKYKVTVTMENTGANPWYYTTSGDFKIAPVADSSVMKYSDWNTTEYFLSSTIDTGQISTIEFYVTAPPVAGIYSLRWRMKKNDNYFGQLTDRAYVNVSGNNTGNVDVSRYNSVFVSQDIPQYMYSGQESPVSITFRNTGSRAWVKGYDQLVMIDSNKNLVTINNWRVGYIQLPENVEPGKSVTFKFNVNPLETGWQNFRMIMKTKEGIFGQPTEMVEIIVSEK
ncbi:MAG TPA: NBR1-Ig-like domain-containing protein [Ignavibacteria bacterium]|nr:NBR1-Ig-like domain-containing protein [Ignavibacteria bacterium]HMR40442.1 NBR1-Ig-like domain-containing protein [Ignavibacteria bacterium]